MEADEAKIAGIGERVDIEIGEAERQRGGSGQDEEDQDRGERRAGHNPARPRLAVAARVHKARPLSSIQRRFSSSRSARRSISRAASSTLYAPRTMRSATICISVKIGRAHV